jgi:hypothetical protein
MVEMVATEFNLQLLEQPLIEQAVAVVEQQAAQVAQVVLVAVVMARLQQVVKMRLSIQVVAAVELAAT